MSNITATVSIGRGAHAAQAPLDDLDWASFRDLVAALLTETVGGVLHVDDASSTGEWNGEPEDSATFVAEIPQHSLAVVRAGLRVLAVTYGQEAIALTLGHTEFVTP
jgi:hypothetical protein